jgi:hypothetical protein
MKGYIARHYGRKVDGTIVSGIRARTTLFPHKSAPTISNMPDMPELKPKML